VDLSPPSGKYPRSRASFIHQRVYAITQFASDVSGRFLYYVMSQTFGAHAMQNSVKATVDSLRLPTFENFLFRKPTRLAEQDAIAEALSDADAYIESLEKLLEKKRAIKQGAMQELLTGKRRLPEFEDEWTKANLGNLLTICHGKNQKAVEDSNGLYPILATGGRIGTANKFLYDKPSVLIGRKGTIDRPQFMDSPFWTVDTLFYSIVHQPNDAKFLFFRFCLIDWKQHNEASGVPSLNAQTIENIEIFVPSHFEQTAIASVLSDMDLELREVESKIMKARDIKQGMMQQLLSGKIRLV
jgi:type I restriction enzyme S subunit